MSLLTTEAVSQRDHVPIEVHDLVETRDDSHCFMLHQKRSDPNAPVYFDHAWVIPPSFFDDLDMDPQVCQIRPRY